MIIYISFIPLLFLPTDSSSIRDRNFRNDLVPLLSSRLDSSKKDANSLKIVSNEPFIIQLQMPNSGESAKKSGKEKDTKRKRPVKKRISKLKPIRKRHRKRRDLQSPKIDLERERKSGRLEISKTEKVTEHQLENSMKNSINRADILKALSSYTKKRETKKGKKYGNNFQKDEESGTEKAKYVSNKTPDGDVQQLHSPLVNMVYPSTPKKDKHLHKYTHKDLMSDRERLEKKIKYIRNMMNLSTADDAVRVRRRSESDRTANKIAKMFLTLSAVNGLHDRRKSKCEENDNDENGYHFWEKESQDNPLKRSSSSNEERYKVKKWIEHMKSKRSSSKTCPCKQERDEERDVFPLEQKLPKNYYNFRKRGGSEESSEVYGDPPYIHRDKSSKNNHSKIRNPKAREDQENKLKALAGKGRKLDLPLDDLELYRAKAKQILQNAEEILDKIKEEEEKRLLSPNIFVNQLKELTSRIQTDPRNNENDLIRKIQKTLGLGSMPKTSDGTDGNNFLENVKSFILDPYEKAKALTDESTKKLSSYLLRNLGELQDSNEMKGNADNKGDLEVFFGQEQEKSLPASLAKVKPDDQSKINEGSLTWTDTVSSALDNWDENKKKEDSNCQQEEQFKKRMEEIIKEQEKKLNGYAEKPDSEESRKELPDRTGNRKEQGENEETLKEEEISMPQPKKDEVRNNRVSTDNKQNETHKIDKSESVHNGAPKQKEFVSQKETAQTGREERTSPPNDVKTNQVTEDSLRRFNENEGRVESEVAPGLKEQNFKEGEKKTSGANKEHAPVQLAGKKSNDQKEVQEVVAAVISEEQETISKEVDPKSEFNYGFTAEGNDEASRSETNEKTEAKVPKYSKEGKSYKETVSMGREETETEPNFENISASTFNKTPNLAVENKGTVGLNDQIPNNGNDFQKRTDQNAPIESTQREVESQMASEHSNLLKGLENMTSNEEKDEAKKNEEEETLQTQGENDTGKKNIKDEISGEDQLSKAFMGNKDQEDFTGGTMHEENSNEDFDESRKEVSDYQEEQNFSDELPVMSATSAEFNEETPSTQHSDEDGKANSQRLKKPAEETPDANEAGTILKATSKEVEEIQYSVEDSNPLKITTNDEGNEKDGNMNVDEKILEMTATAEEVSDKLENPEGGNKALLQSIQNESLESGKDAEEVNLKTANPGQDGNDEGTEIQDEESGNRPTIANSVLDVTGEDLKGRGSNELVSGEQKEENFDEGKEIDLKATGPTDELDRETKSLESDGIADIISKEENSDNRSGTEREDKDILSSALEGQDPENINMTEEIPYETSGGIIKQDERNENGMAEGGILKGTPADMSRESTDNNDARESSLQELKIIHDPLKNEVDKSKEVEVGLDNQITANEDTNDETSLKAAYNEEATNLNGNEEDNEVPLQVTLYDKDPKIDDEDEEQRKEDGDFSDDTLMKSLNKDNNVSAEDSDETPLRTMLTDEDLQNEEGEENRDRNEAINDGDHSSQSTIIPIGLKTNKNSNKSLEDDKTPLKATRNNDDEATMQDTDENLKATRNNDDEETMQDIDEALKTTRNNDDEETMQDIDEALKTTRNNDDKETIQDTDESLKATRNNDDEATMQDTDESLKATRNNDDEETMQDTDDSLKATRNNDDEETMQDIDEALKTTRNNDDEETMQDIDEALKTTRNNDDEETIQDTDESLKATRNNDDEETMQDTDDSLKATRNNDDEETMQDIDEALKTTRNNDDEETMQDIDEALKTTRNNDDEETMQDIDEALKTTRNNDDEETIQDTDESLKATRNNDDEETMQDTDDSLKATRNNDDEEILEDADETPLKAVKIDPDDKVENPNEAFQETLDIEENIAVAKDPEKVNQRNIALNDENPSRAGNFEEVNNLYEGDEIPLRAATDDVNVSEHFKSIIKDGSDESLKEGNLPNTINNQTGGQNEVEAPLNSFKSFDGIQEESEEKFETLKKENPSDDSEEGQGQAFGTEDESPLAPADTVRQTTYQRNPKEEIQSENLQAFHPSSHPLKANTLKVPTSIAKIMKDLEGKEKDDITTIENLNPEKIDYIIDKIDEVEQQNKVTDEEDCRRECACAEDINTRSRNIGRYEIVKDFLQWMKDLQLNRVLSDD